MNSRTKNIIQSIAIIVFTCISFWSFGQEDAPAIREDFSDEELTSFVDAYEGVVSVQQESEQKMVAAIEDEDMTLERFNQVLAMQQDPTTESDASAEEMTSFNNAAQKIIKERQDAETKVISIIEDNGLDINTYQEIMIAYQHSPKVQEKVNKLLEQ